MADSTTRLREADLRATAPRVAVLDTLESARIASEHLTATEIADRVAARIGAVSLQAVYDCLAALEQAELVRRIQPAGHPAHFEARVGDNHHHVVCRSCGRTEDIDCVVGEAPCVHPSSAGGFVIDQAEITFWGLCPDCAASAAATP
ncbi:Fur family transcriptional regulator [Amnibacterium flavum]|uniref:Transcriptional repressor n=1 Tax=Amnibacterium flavum TaxID=2173173 RepID=A0A2V1HT76_9MICO|nr:Fur family transcriptional regulator [Amnibacterium flavum]PVZ95541.1 transcriptional repressor [Amnibacterium flavum]